MLKNQGTKAFIESTYEWQLASHWARMKGRPRNSKGGIKTATLGFGWLCPVSRSLCIFSVRFTSWQECIFLKLAVLHGKLTKVWHHPFPVSLCWEVIWFRLISTGELCHFVVFAMSATAAWHCCGTFWECMALLCIWSWAVPYVGHWNRLMPVPWKEPVAVVLGALLTAPTAKSPSWSCGGHRAPFSGCASWLLLPADFPTARHDHSWHWDPIHHVHGSLWLYSLTSSGCECQVRYTESVVVHSSLNDEIFLLPDLSSWSWKGWCEKWSEMLVGHLSPVVLHLV